jgi:RpiR family carbohydrate utilization transcriptional regulator
MSVIEALKEKRGFTALEADIADYLLHHAESVSKMSIADLSAATYSSNATIVRLCRKLGLDGYRDLRLAFATELERRRQQLSDIDVNTPFTEKESTATIMRSVAELSKEAIETCYGSVSPDAIDAVAQRIVSARSVILYAVGDSYTSAEMFRELLAKLGILCINAYETGDTLPKAYMATQSDLALFVTYSGRILESLVPDLEVLHERGCPTAIITARESSAMPDDGFDCRIVFPFREALHGRIATFYSETCIRYILNCLYSSVYSLDYRRFNEVKGRIDTQNH